VHKVILELTKGDPKNGVTLIHMKGSIHTGPDCRRVEHEVEKLIAAGEVRVIFDMAAVTHIDSAAIGSIVRSLSNLKKAGGGLRLAGATGMIASSFKLTKLDRIVPLFPSVAEASENFSAAAPPPGNK